MNENQLKTELRPLLDQMLNNTISDSDFKKLDEMLTASRVARDYYRAYTDLDFEMRQAHIGTYEQTELLPAGKSTRTPGSGPGLMMRIYQASLTAAIIVIGMMTYLLMHDRDNRQTASATLITSNHALYEGYGDLRFIENVVLDGPHGVSEGRLGSQPLHLKSGKVSIKLDSGIELLLQGPAKFTLTGETQCEMTQGKLLVTNDDPEAQIVITTPRAQIKDIGTQFGLYIDATGTHQTHVYEGSIELRSQRKDGEEKAEATQLLLKATESAALSDMEAFVKVDDNPELFNDMKLQDNQRLELLRLQFDCGTGAGIYTGTNSPAHSDGLLKSYESIWNPIAGSHSGTVISADGRPASARLNIQIGEYDGYNKRKRKLDWSIQPITRVKQVRKGSVFDSSLGRDSMNGFGMIGIRISGLPSGQYRVYLIGRSALFNPNWGDYGKTKSYDNAIGINLIDMPQKGLLPIEPIKRLGSDHWVNGQTHVTKEITIDDPEAQLTLLARLDNKRSINPKGGRHAIIGFQIIQLSN